MKTSAIINGFLGGLIVGLLFAPASGEETRRKLNQMIARWRYGNSENFTNESGLPDTRENEFLEETRQPLTLD